MPRSQFPEADTPEGAVQRAKEMHGPNVQITAVNPVRSGGVLGFFATERYRVEVDGADGVSSTEPEVKPEVALSEALHELDTLFSESSNAEDSAGAGSYPMNREGYAFRTQGPIGEAQAPSTTVRPPTGFQGPSEWFAAATEQPSVLPASPFAAALARVHVEPEVVEAVEVAADAPESTDGLVPDSATTADRLRNLPLSAALVSDRGPASTATFAPAHTFRAPTSGSDEDPEHLLPRLAHLGVPAGFIPDGFLNEVSSRGLHSALTRLLRMRLPQVPPLPVELGRVVIVGPGTEALDAARTLATKMGLSVETIRFAAPAEQTKMVSVLARITSFDDAEHWAKRRTEIGPTRIVAVSAPMSAAAAPWTNRMIEALSPEVLFAAVDATRKVGDVGRWAARLPSVDGILLDARESADPGTYLKPPVAPVALIDGDQASAPRWASLLCERLEETETQ
jgi:hypothetical protein